ncbi:uncharacterized protein OCT59_006211 [Rhizophagus irregularis]|uniref:uncharacterized protein n=1 Tax=Rhizophagus irregularis TaxID=588596 RepID=UPI00332C15C9|nr:hypothetical protein OCT59_006211 [Rhizophagus irregularis]
MYTPHAVSVIPELPNLRAEAERVLWKRHKKAEEAYDRAVEKKEKANDALSQSLEEEGILHELEWKAYQKACKELTDTRKKLTIVKGARAVWISDICSLKKGKGRFRAVVKVRDL